MPLYSWGIVVPPILSGDVPLYSWGIVVQPILSGRCTPCPGGGDTTYLIWRCTPVLMEVVVQPILSGGCAPVLMGDSGTTYPVWGDVPLYSWGIVVPPILSGGVPLYSWGIVVPPILSGGCTPVLMGDSGTTHPV